MRAQSLWLLSSLALSHAASIPRAAANDHVDCGNATAGTAATVIFEGRIPQSATVKDFDSDANAFRPDYTKGANLSFSDLIVFPGGSPSLFDKNTNTKSLEVTLSDDSIFQPGSSQPQSAIRRAELIPSLSKTANNITTIGVKTLHFSMKPDPQRALNISHEYLTVFLECADFSGDQFMLKTGTLIGSDGSSKNNLVLFGNTKNGSPNLFSTPFAADEFTNLAFRLDFVQNTIQVFQSTGDSPLTQQTEPLPNDLSGNGEYHFGAFKSPTNPGADSLRSGYQESGIDEGIIYGGIFIEDSASGAISLS